jgi:hypothetical protein
MHCQDSKQSDIAFVICLKGSVCYGISVGNKFVNILDDLISIIAPFLGHAILGEKFDGGPKYFRLILRAEIPGDNRSFGKSQPIAAANRSVHFALKLSPASHKFANQLASASSTFTIGHVVPRELAMNKTDDRILSLTKRIMGALVRQPPKPHAEMKLRNSSGETPDDRTRIRHQRLKKGGAK